MKILILLIIALGVAWLLITRTKNKPVESEPYDISKDLKNQRKQTWKKITNSYTHTISDQTLELVSNTNNTFEHPSVPDFDSYEDPHVSENQLDEFVTWAGQTDRNKGRAKLSNLITTDFSIQSPEISVDLMDMQKTEGLFQCEDYCVTGYLISKGYTGALVTKNEDLVRLLISPHLMYWHEWDDALHMEPEDECYYLNVNDAEFVPQSGKAWGLFEQAVEYDMEVYYEIDGEIPFFDEKYTINGTKFKIFKKEKDFLVILLMLTYNRELLRRVMDRLEV